MTSLSDKLAAALSSRERRLIRRRLPDPLSDTLREIDFTSNDYLSLSTSPALRQAVLAALAASQNILGSGGSRLLVPSQPHIQLESRLRRFFGADAALLFNSGFEANVGFFSVVPQPGDVILYDAYIHASVHDGMRLSKLAPDSRVPFPHNSVRDLRRILSKLLEDRESLRRGKSDVFVAVESLYSMEGSMAPLTQIVECVEEMLPLGNGHVVVDEAHATGIYGPNGRGLVADLGLEKRVFARLHTFGKALAASGAVILTTELVKEYILNYARTFIYTTALPCANIVAVHCSFDTLEDGTAEALSARLLAMSTYFVDLLRSRLKKLPSSLLSLPDHLVPTISEQGNSEPAREQSRPWEIDPRDKRSWPTRAKTSATRDNTPDAEPRGHLPTPIIPILTPEPRALSSFLLSYATSSSAASSAVLPDEPSSPSSSASGLPTSTSPTLATSAQRPLPATLVALRTKPIYPPTVPKGTALVRICLHAGHTRADVALLADGIAAWGEAYMTAKRRDGEAWRARMRDAGVAAWMGAKL